MARRGKKPGSRKTGGLKRGTPLELRWCPASGGRRFGLPDWPGFHSQGSGWVIWDLSLLASAGSSVWQKGRAAPSGNRISQRWPPAAGP